MTMHHIARRAPTTPVPTLEALAAEAVRLGREAVAAVQEAALAAAGVRLPPPGSGDG